MANPPDSSFLFAVRGICRASACRFFIEIVTIESSPNYPGRNMVEKSNEEAGQVKCDNQT